MSRRQPAGRPREAALTRMAARLSTGCLLAGFGLVLVAMVASRRLWFGGYVSEAGLGPRAEVYRVGVLGVGLGLLLLAVALARSLPVAAALLAAAGVAAGLSGAVTCSAGCPLPPHELPTRADLMHGAASALAVGAVSLAIISVARSYDGDGYLRRVSRLAALAVTPLVAGTGLLIVVLGRGLLTGVLERGALTGATVWSLAVSLRLSRPHPHHRPHHHDPPNDLPTTANTTTTVSQQHHRS